MYQPEQRNYSLVDSYKDPREKYIDQKSRKRPRQSSLRPSAEIGSESLISCFPSMKTTIQVGDSSRIKDLYERQFKNCQQTACKFIAKAWVKAVEPRKQSNHPYTGGENTRPKWWPDAYDEEHKKWVVRHREPDHLYKNGMADGIY